MTDRFGPDEVARFRVAVTRVDKGVDRRVDADGMTRTQTSTLSTVARTGPLGAGELAAVEGLNPTMLSRVVGKLADRGLVTRTPDPDDKRVTLVAVTAEGRAVHQRLRRQRTGVFAAAVREIGPDHAAALRQALPALEALAAALDHDRTPAGATR